VSSKGFVLLGAAAIVAISLSEPAFSQPAASGVTAEALSTRDERAQKREMRHLRTKQKKLLKRQRAKAKQHFRRGHQPPQ
jgi:Ni/Co efflux regulator RcnB